MLMNKQEYKIHIIGAGISGLIAAKVLEDHGYSPIVMEASDRVGGRVFVDRVARDIAVSRCDHVELVDVVQVDRHHGGIETTVAGVGSYRDIVAGRRFAIQQRPIRHRDECLSCSHAPEQDHSRDPSQIRWEPLRWMAV